MEDYSKLAKEAVLKGADPEKMAKLSVEAELPIYSWLLDNERIEAVKRRQTARDELHRLSGTPQYLIDIGTSPYLPCYCGPINEASVEQLTELYKKITGHDPEPGRIEAMKGECKLEPSVEIEKCPIVIVGDVDTVSKLRKSIQEEIEAFVTYGARAEDAEKQGDFQTSALYQHVMNEEKEHKEEFEARKRELQVY